MNLSKNVILQKHQRLWAETNGELGQPIRCRFLRLQCLECTSTTALVHRALAPRKRRVARSGKAIRITTWTSAACPISSTTLALARTAESTRVAAGLESDRTLPDTTRLPLVFASLVTLCREHRMLSLNRPLRIWSLMVFDWAGSLRRILWAGIEMPSVPRLVLVS